jgi:hypothetical protein
MILAVELGFIAAILLLTGYLQKRKSNFL